MIDILSLALLLTVLVLNASILAFHWLTGVPPLPARIGEAVDTVALLKYAELPKQAIIYDLGCGWGSLVIALANAFPDATIKGIELSPLPYWIARFRTRHMTNVSLQRGNFYKSDLKDASAVTCYLMIRVMPKVADFLDHMLAPGTPVVAVSFWFREREIEASRKGKGVRGDVALYFWPAPLEQTLVPT
jgi:tRNA A58 N-methylase Trm61